MSDRPIGVFDSGLGGLTVLRSLIDLLPNEHFVYFGDTARFPYGTKAHEEVLEYALQIGEVLVSMNVKSMVAACNSATSVALDALRERHPIPIIGVIEPGVRAATMATRSGRVGVIATVGTVSSGSYQLACETLAPELDVTFAACPGFVEFVEAGDVVSDQVHVLAERLLAPVRDAKVDTLVLGCTHYPLLARTISDVMGPDVVLVSSADETAFDLRARLQPRVGERVAHAARFITSGDGATFRHLATRFLGPEVVDVEEWRWT
ncbi:MAG: glutamate racemase [Acidimicrobiia bacterium]